MDDNSAFRLTIEDLTPLPLVLVPFSEGATFFSQVLGKALTRP